MPITNPPARTDWKESVRVATTAAGTLGTDFENGDTVDGIVLATDDRLLLKNQSSGVENGIHVVNASGAPTRADDYDAGKSVANTVVMVEEGTANADKAFQCTNNAGSDVVGTNALVFVEFGAGGGAAGEFSKSITVEDPTSSEDIALFKTKVAITVSQLTFVLRGSSSPSVTVTIRHSTDRNATGNEVVTGGTVVTDVTTGQDVTSFDDETIPAGSFIWLETTAKSGTVDELHVSLFANED